MDQVYILWGQESTLDLAKIKAWSKMTNFFKKLFTQEVKQEAQPKSNCNNKKDYWTEYYIEERKKLIAKIEELKKVYKVEVDIFIEKNIKTSDNMSDSMNAFLQDLYRDEMLPKSLRFYNYLSNLAETTQEHNIYLVEKILDTIISHKKEENVENSHRNWMSEQRENIDKLEKDLKEKEKELEKREANIVKIEASQIILNSELAKELTNNLK